MSRLIDADELLERLERKKPAPAKVRFTEGFNDAILRVRSMVHGAPTVDAVPVIRCRNCSSWKHTGGGLGDCTNNRFYIPGSCTPTTKADDFCSCGIPNRVPVITPGEPKTCSGLIEED